MERRREVRLEANEPVVLTELGPNHGHPIGGMIRDFSNAGMSIRLARAIPCHAAVRVETGTLLLLGEVVRCERDGEEFRVALAIRHSLQNLQDLANLNKALLSYGTAASEHEARQEAPIMRE
jgi:hypothetical protein